MGKEESETFGRHSKFMVPQDVSNQIPNNLMLPHCTTNMQAQDFFCHEPFLHYDHHMCQNRANNALRYNAVHEPAKVSNQSMVAEDLTSSKKEKPIIVIKEEYPSADEAQRIIMEAERKQRKRQSNKESARRARLRKQEEHEDLLKRIEILKNENSAATKTLVTYSEECLKLIDENDFLEKELIEMYGAEAIADLLAMKPT